MTEAEKDIEIARLTRALLAHIERVRDLEGQMTRWKSTLAGEPSDADPMPIPGGEDARTPEAVRVRCMRLRARVNEACEAVQRLYAEACVLMHGLEEPPR